MSQGYGPPDGQQWGQQDAGQQGQWGQQPPPQPAQPQWGQQSPPPPAAPQWGQQSPPPPGAPGPAAAPDPWGQQPGQPAFGSPAEPAPAGYPGAVGGSPQPGTPQFRPGDGVNWQRVRMLGMILLIGVVLLLLIRLGMSLAQFVMAPSMAAQGQDPGALAVGTSLVTILLWIGNLLVSLVVLVVAIVAAVMGRGRARIGGIVLAVMIPVSAIASFIVGGITGAILGGAGLIDPMTGVFSAGGYQILAVVDAIRVLVVIAIMGAAAWFVADTAKKQLAA